MKQKFNIITSTCVPLPLENVDTDQIIPARFLKATTREEKFFGDNLFRDWRYNPKVFRLLLLPRRIMEKVPAVNMQHGLSPDMVSG